MMCRHALEPNLPLQPLAETVKVVLCALYPQIPHDREFYVKSKVVR